MAQKTLIIPDIHNNHSLAESIIDREVPDRTVFLGDYFDDIGDNAHDADRTARWLVGSLEHPDRVHLFGNHDLQYVSDNPTLTCSGYSDAKKAVIGRHHIDRRKMRLYFWVGDWLCTHAGLSNRFFVQQQKTEQETLQDVLGRSEMDLETIDDEDASHPFLQVGYLRGGLHDVGGLVWCDYHEFEDIPGTKQIFGHTRGPDVRHRHTGSAEHYCIDTVLHNYAIYEDERLQVMSVK